jgi:hypothetical protein
MLDFVEKYARNVSFSQNGEEGILIECLKRMSIVTGYAVEVGANDGLYCSNTALLLSAGWLGRMIEADYALYLECRQNWQRLNPRVNCVCCEVNAQNVNAFVPEGCDVFSTDTDGEDYRIFQGLKTRPKIVIVEIDSSIPPHHRAFNVDGAAGYAEMVILGEAKGYFLLCHTGNLIFVHENYRDLFPEITADPLMESIAYFNRAWLREEAV